MIEPQAGRHIARICEVLEQTTLADMASPYAQRQLKAGLWALRDLAARLPTQAQRMREDIADMEQFLASNGGAVAGMDPGESLPDYHMRLQGRIEALEAASPSPALRALHIRMIARESVADDIARLPGE